MFLMTLNDLERLLHTGHLSERLRYSVKTAKHIVEITT